MCKCDISEQEAPMRIPARSMLTALLLSALALTIHGCGNDHTAPYREYHFTGMGGNITVLLAGTSENPDAAAEKCAKEMAAHGNSLSGDNPASDVYAINGEINHFITEDETLMQMLTLSETVTELTGGSFDCTYGALYDLWQPGVIPEEADVADALSHCGRDKFTVSGKTITKNDTAAKLDFSALIPGMAVQKAVESLYEAGIPCGIVSVDDTCGVFGTKPDGDTFKIGLKDPRDTDAVFGYLTVNSGFIASAGDYLNASADSEKIHTVLDLSTGYPPETDLDSVTVYAANGAAASALSSALYAMGLDDALALYESDPAVLFEAVFVTESGEVIVTPGAADLFELNGEKYMLRSSGLE